MTELSNSNMLCNQMSTHSNQRVQQAEGRLGQVEDRLQGVEVRLNAVDNGVQHIAQTLVTPKAEKNTATKVSTAAALANALCAVVTLGFLFYQTLHSLPKLQTQISHAQSDIQMLTQALAPELLDRIGKVYDDAAVDPNAATPKLLQSADTLRNLQTVAFRPDAQVFRGANSAAVRFLKMHPADNAGWKLAAELVSYQYTMPLLPRVHLLDCKNFRGTMRVTKSVKNPKGEGYETTIEGPTKVNHCRLDLDDPQTQQWLGEQSALFDLELTECLVIYRGSPLKIVRPPATWFDDNTGHAEVVAPDQLKKVPLRKIRFVHCAFDIQLPGVPVPVVQTITRGLLVAQTNDLSFTADELIG